MVGRSLWIVILAVFSHYSQGGTGTEKFVDSGILESRFATKTKYRHRIRQKDSLSWLSRNIPDGLKPVSIDATLRHGTRFPSEKRAEIWKNVVPKFRNLTQEFSSEVRSSIRQWENKFAESSYYLLTWTGWKEHVSLGSKYYSMMPQLWHRVLDRNGVADDADFLVLSSSKIRVLASAKAFLSGLQFSSKYGSQVETDDSDIRYHERKVAVESNEKNDEDVIRYGNVSVIVNDELLRFFDDCKKYVQSVDKNTTASHEFDDFFKSKEINRVLQRFTRINDNKDIYYIYQLCAFEKAVFDHSVWCELFTHSDLSILEYASDLKHYYITGPGYEINVKQACRLLKHIFERLKNNLRDRYSATLRFGHAETLIPLVSLLDFYKEDGPLTSSNYEQKVHRNFRTGKISPFSGNLAIVLYESKLDPHKQIISFAINEQLVKPFGQDCYFCEFGQDSVVYKKILGKLEGCDTVCELDTPIKEEL